MVQNCMLCNSQFQVCSLEVLPLPLYLYFVLSIIARQWTVHVCAIWTLPVPLPTPTGYILQMKVAPCFLSFFLSLLSLSLFFLIVKSADSAWKTTPISPPNPHKKGTSVRLWWVEDNTLTVLVSS